MSNNPFGATNKDWLDKEEAFEQSNQAMRDLLQSGMPIQDVVQTVHPQKLLHDNPQYFHNNLLNFVKYPKRFLQPHEAKALIEASKGTGTDYDKTSAKYNSGQMAYALANHIKLQETRNNIKNVIPQTADLPATSDWTSDFLRYLTSISPEAKVHLKDHPSYELTHEEEGMEEAADFWYNYENSVEPSHFATIKAYHTKEPQYITDHRGQEGSSEDYQHIIPHLDNYAKASQQAVLNDPKITKKNFHGIPHVQVYRGFAGNYANALREQMNITPPDSQAFTATASTDDKNIALPSAPFSSWSTDPDVAQGFAERNIYGHPSGRGVVLKKWMPVHQILHSGFHDATPGQHHAHVDEKELVFQHPDAKVKINGSNVHGIIDGNKLHLVNKRPKPIKAPKEPLTKMALASIPVGPQVPTPPKLKPEHVAPTHTYDYSHVLPQHAQGIYQLHVQDRPKGSSAVLTHNNNPVGISSINIRHNDQMYFPTPTNVATFSLADLDTEHQGKGLGSAMYEAVLAHAKNHHKTSILLGGTHSSMASAVHQKLANKHGMEYQAKANPGRHVPGPYDEAYGQYQYALKSEELIKSTPEGIKTYNDNYSTYLNNGTALKDRNVTITETPGQIKKIQTIAQHPIAIHIPSRKLASVANTGRLLNVFDANSKDDDYNTTRELTEQSILGIPYETPNSHRPIYGAIHKDFHNSNKGTGPAPEYGDVWLQLHDHVKNRSTFTPGDSFSSTSKAVTSAHLEDVVRGHFKKHANDYIEAQIHGGVNPATDVHSIHITPSHHQNTQDAINFGKKFNIPVYHYRHGNNEPATLYHPEQNPLGESESKSLVSPTPTPHGSSLSSVDQLKSSIPPSGLAKAEHIPDEVDRMLASPKRSDFDIGLKMGNLTSEHLARAVPQDYVRTEAVLKHPKANSDVIDAMLARHDNKWPGDVPWFGNLIAKHPHATPGQLHDLADRVLNSYPEDNDVAATAENLLDNPNTPTPAINQLNNARLNGHEHITEAQILHHPNAPQELKDAFNRKQTTVPESEHITHSMGKNLGKLRKLRDHILQHSTIKQMSPKDLPQGDWSAFRLPNGNISADAIQQHIDNLPKMEHGTYHTLWTGAQRHTDEPSNVFGLHLTQTQLDQINANPEAAAEYRRKSNILASSGHPGANMHSLGWLRSTKGIDGNYQIDEVQSDWPGLLNTKGNAEHDVPPNPAHQHISNVMFQGHNPNEIMTEAFMQHLRNKGEHNAIVSFHTPETKAPLSNLDPDKPVPGHFHTTYDKIPKSQGATPATYGSIDTQTNPDLQGKPQHQTIVRKFEDHLKDWLTNLRKSSNSFTTAKEEFSHVIDHLHGYHPQLSRAFEAAAILANQGPRTYQEARQALFDADGNLHAAALLAHKLPVNKENLLGLNSILKLLTLPYHGMFTKSYDHSHGLGPSEEAIKTFLQPGYFPQGFIVTAPQAEAQDMLQRVQYGVAEGLTSELKLNGKHSLGAVMVTDEHEQSILLKPGSGDLPDSAGLQEEHASQSEREAAFYQVSKAVNLEASYVPCQLVIINAKEYAAMDLLPWDFVSLERKRSDDPTLPTRIFHQPLSIGRLHQWAALDYICGNTDRHISNIMVDDDFTVKLIDNGSSFAGKDFDPTDKLTFVPYYLRYTCPEDVNFNSLTPEQKIRYMPVLPIGQEPYVKSWLDAIDPVFLATFLVRYHINPQPTMDRLSRLKELAGQGSVGDAILHVWSNP